MRNFLLGLAASTSLSIGAQAEVCIPEQALCFPTPSAAFRAAKPGNTVLLGPQDYRGDVAVITVPNLRIVGVPGKTRLFADGKSAEGKGIWVVRNWRTTIEGIEFHRAEVPLQNAAAIRFEGNYLTVSQCRFIENRNSILVGKRPSAVIVLVDSEIIGHPEYGDQNHNLYIGEIAHFTMRGVWSHSANGGHLLKSRARVNDIQGNRFTDNGKGASYEAEFPSGGDVYFAGNIVEQSPLSANKIMLRYGAEYQKVPLPGIPRMRLVQNTFINHANTGLIYKVDAVPKLASEVMANLFLGPGIAVKAGNYRSFSRDVLPSPMPQTVRPYAQYRYRHPYQHEVRSDLDYGAGITASMIHANSP